MSKRTDNHRPGAIIPAEYKIELSYNCSTSDGGYPVPSYGINCELDRAKRDAKGIAIIESGKHDATGACCFVGARMHGETFPIHGSPGKCDVCGTAHVYGDIWRHIPTGELIVVGHICATNYGLLADRSEFELGLMRRKAATAKACKAAQNAEEREAFFVANPGLEAALALDHHILRDLASKAFEYRSLSPKQIALAFKIADEIRNPKPAEKHVDAPTGRVVVEGTIVSIKCHDGFYGPTMKMTTKVETPEGSWLVWCTMPSSLRGANRGDKIRFTATLSAKEDGTDKHFVFGKRPSATEIVEMGPESAEKEARANAPTHDVAALTIGAFLWCFTGENDRETFTVRA